MLCFQVYAQNNNRDESIYIHLKPTKK